MRTALILALFSLASIAQEGALPPGVSLPPGMTVEQAKQLARERGLAIPGEGGTSGQTSPQADMRPKMVEDRSGAIDPLEGIGETEGAEDAQKGKQPHLDSISLRNLRYGQRLFRTANPTLFGSHSGAVGANYELGPGDEIILTLWGQKEARYLLTLDRDGQASIEGIGVVSLNGLALKDAEKLLRSRLSRIYSGMNSNLIGMDLTMGKLKQIRVFIVGDASHPGGYMFSGNTTVFNALYQAKGPSSLGSERRIEVIRGSQRFEVDLYDYLFRAKRPTNDVLHDGDIVRVPPRGPVIAINGDIGRPGLYELLPNEAAKELLLYAGGLTPTTAKQNMTALRVFENGRTDVVILPSPQDVFFGKAVAPLQDGDQLQVFRGRDPSQQTVFVSGEVRFPGSYPFVEGMTQKDLIAKAGGPTGEAFFERALVSRQEPNGSASLYRTTVFPASDFKIQPLDQIVVFNRFKMIREQFVTITGQVRLPGRYPHQQGMTVKDLILLAGGFAEHPDYGAIRVETPLDQGRGARVETFAVDSALAMGSSEQPLVENAHVAVPRDPLWHPLELVVVRGKVARPGNYSLLSPDERISSVVARAGGILPEGYPDAAVLFRSENQVGRVQVSLPAAMSKPGSLNDIEMRAGDTLTIPLRPATVEVRGRVNSPTHVLWQKGKPWDWYVQMAGGFADSSDRSGVYVQYADGSIQTRDGGLEKPNPGAVVIVPFKKPAEPTTIKDFLGGLNAVLATVIAGLTIFVLTNK